MEGFLVCVCDESFEEFLWQQVCGPALFYPSKFDN